MYSQAAIYVSDLALLLTQTKSSAGQVNIVCKNGIELHLIVIS
jgi:hypothetical protein